MHKKIYLLSFLIIVDYFYTKSPSSRPEKKIDLVILSPLFFHLVFGMREEGGWRGWHPLLALYMGLLGLMGLGPPLCSARETRSFHMAADGFLFLRFPRQPVLRA